MDKLLSDESIRDAIIVDFEGRTDRAPILLGVRWPLADGRAQIEQLVLNARFAPAAIARGLLMSSIEEAVQAVVERSEAEGLPIAGWSRHEIDVVADHCSARLARRFTERYLDAKVTAKSARARRRVELPPARGREKRHALGRYLKLVGYDVPFPYGPGWTGETIRVVGAALDRHCAWSLLTPHQKRRWSFLLSHNRADLEGTAAVIGWATSVLADPDRVAA